MAGVSVMVEVEAVTGQEWTGVLFPGETCDLEAMGCAPRGEGAAAAGEEATRLTSVMVAAEVMEAAGRDLSRAAGGLLLWMIWTSGVRGECSCRGDTCCLGETWLLPPRCLGEAREEAGEVTDTDMGDLTATAAVIRVTGFGVAGEAIGAGDADAGRGVGGVAAVDMDR